MENSNIRPLSFKKGVGYTLLFLVLFVFFAFLISIGFGIYKVVDLFNLPLDSETLKVIILVYIKDSIYSISFYSYIAAFFSVGFVFFRKEENKIVSFKRILVSESDVPLRVWLAFVPIFFFLRTIGMMLLSFKNNGLELDEVIRDAAEFNVYPLLFILVAAPLFEEIFFRGILLKGFENKYSGTKPLVISSFLFAVIHIFLGNIIFAFFVGLFLGWIYKKTGSLVFSIYCHFIINLSVVVCLRLKMDFGGFFNLSSPPLLKEFFVFSAIFLLFLFSIRIFNNSLKKVTQ